MIDTSPVVVLLRQCYASAVLTALSVHVKSTLRHNPRNWQFCEFLMSKKHYTKLCKKCQEKVSCFLKVNYTYFNSENSDSAMMQNSLSLDVLLWRVLIFSIPMMRYCSMCAIHFLISCHQKKLMKSAWQNSLFR